MNKAYATYSDFKGVAKELLIVGKKNTNKIRQFLKVGEALRIEGDPFQESCTVVQGL